MNFVTLVVASSATAAPSRAATVTIVCGSSPPAVELCREGSTAWAQARGHEVRVLGYPESSMRARDLLAVCKDKCAGVYFVPSFGRYDIVADLISAAR